MPEEKKSIGAIWIKTSKSNGNKYLSGSWDGAEGEEKIKFVAFKNKSKSKNEQQPDFIIFRSEPMKREESSPSLDDIDF